MGRRDLFASTVYAMDNSETLNPDATTLIDPESQTQEPKRYKILLHNDDYTPMEFVVEIVQEFFQMSYEQANQIMLDVHNKGIAVCGAFPFEIAETKVSAISRRSRDNDYPLKCTMEVE